MSQYSDARNFFEINMVKDFFCIKKMQTITDKEVIFLKRCISNCNSSILDVMCGYGRIGNKLFDLGYHNLEGVDLGNFTFINEKKTLNFIMMIFIPGLNIYIKRIPNIENRVMDIFGKSDDIRKLINSITNFNNRTLLNIINDRELSEQNFSNYNLRFADLNGVIEEELNMYTLTKESEIDGVRSKILLRNRGTK